MCLGRMNFKRNIRSCLFWECRHSVRICRRPCRDRSQLCRENKLNFINLFYLLIAGIFFRDVLFEIAEDAGLVFSSLSDRTWGRLPPHTNAF
jgi:hypothetical protein